MLEQQTSQPDFIPASGGGASTASPDFIPLASTPAPDAKQEPSGPVMRFIKGAASKYLGATLNAGPTNSTPAMYGTPEWQQAEQAARDRYKSGQPQPSISDFIKASSLSNIPDNALREVKTLNPIDTQKFESGDVAGGMGSSLMNLLMLRQAFKGNNLPVFGSPAQTAEIVQPLTGGTKLQPKPNVTVHDVPSYTVSPAQGAPQNLLDQLTRKAASGSTGLQGEFQVTPGEDTGIQPSAAQPIRSTPNMAIYDEAGMSNSAPAQLKPLNKNTNSLLQEYFIQKTRDSLNRQTVTGSAEQDAANARMAEYAKTPVDKMQVSGEAPQFAYRVRDAGDTGIMPKGHAQATTDLSQAQSYLPGRGAAQKAPQELVKVDLSKLDPSEYQIVPGPGGKQWVRFKSAVPESFIEKVGDEPRVPTSDADLQNLLMRSVQAARAKKAMSAKAGDD